MIYNFETNIDISNSKKCKHEKGRYEIGKTISIPSGECSRQHYIRPDCVCGSILSFERKLSTQSGKVPFPESNPRTAMKRALIEDETNDISTSK